MNFGIVTYIHHKEYNNKYYSYSPYIREMNIWAKFVDELSVISPINIKDPSTIEQPYNKSINYHSIPEIEFTNIPNALKSIIKLPIIVFKLIRFFKTVDHVHLRCPGNIGLIGCIIQIFFPKKVKTVKYAGNWDPKSKQPLSYKIQKWILNNTLLSKNISVLVYGDWPKQSVNIKPFFTATFSELEFIDIKKDFNLPYKFIFVGTLSEGKQPLFAIKMVQSLIANNIPSTLGLYGDGNLAKEISNYIRMNNLESSIKLEGYKEIEELKKEYISSHFLILPSQSEGWPKAVAEAMFFGCIPVVPPISCIPWMLNYGERGVLIDKNNISRAKETLIPHLRNVKNLELMSQKAIKWSREYTTEKFELEIRELL